MVWNWGQKYKLSNGWKRVLKCFISHWWNFGQNLDFFLRHFEIEIARVRKNKQNLLHLGAGWPVISSTKEYCFFKLVIGVGQRKLSSGWDTRVISLYVKRGSWTLASSQVKCFLTAAQGVLWCCNIDLQLSLWGCSFLCCFRKLSPNSKQGKKTFWERGKPIWLLALEWYLQFAVKYAFWVS